MADSVAGERAAAGAGASSVRRTTGVVGVVLAAGAGTRLRPLTRLRPKPLCPVGGVALVDRALDWLEPGVSTIAVNVHHGRSAMVDHLGGRVHLSIEEPVALGTAGALRALREWIDGRSVVVVNADAWTSATVAQVLDGWDGERPRLALAGPPRLDPRSSVVASVLPASALDAIPAGPSGLYEVCWRPSLAAGCLDVVGIDAGFVDCGTPAGYLAANLATSGGRPVVGEGAVVEGTLERSVVWPGARVAPAEHLVDAIRADGLTVLVR